MRIQLTKGKDDKDSLSCFRNDGSSTTTELGPGSAYHELSHYVVETIMDYHQGFFGMLASGRDIAEFDMQNEERSFQIPREGYYAEFLASLIQGSVGSGNVDPEYVEMLRKGAENMNLPFPEIPDPKLLDQMRLQAAALIHEWNILLPGESMEVVYPEEA